MDFSNISMSEVDQSNNSMIKMEHSNSILLSSVPDTSGHHVGVSLSVPHTRLTSAIPGTDAIYPGLSHNVR